MLSDSQRNSCYVHLDVPIPGIPDTNYALGIAAYDESLPFWSQPSTLYERVLNLRPVEESYLTGLPIAEIIMTGTPQSGGSVEVSATPTTGGSAVAIGEYAPTTSDLVAIEPLFQITTGLTQSVNGSNTPYTAYCGPHEAGNALAAAQASMSVVGLVNAAPFTLALTIDGIAAYVATQGVLPAISHVFNGTSPATVYGLLPILDYLLPAVAGSSDFASFLKADVVSFDPGEMAKRAALYRYYQVRLAKFFFGPMGTRFLSGGRRMGGAIA